MKWMVGEYKPALSVEERDTLRRPFFFRMKLVPMNKLELTAKMSPIMNSWLIWTDSDVQLVGVVKWASIETSAAVEKLMDERSCK